MISPEESLPKKSEKYLQGQDIVWTQFNDVNFYVEDIDQENFYLIVLRKLFPTLKINRIFPRGGKDPIIEEAKKSLRNKKKVFILDQDFDEILNKKENLKNVFYLKKYSIENYLLEKDAICEFIKEERPKIKPITLKSFDPNLFYKECSAILSDLSTNFLIIKKFELGLTYLKIDPQRDCEFNVNPCRIRHHVTTPYYSSVKAALSLKRPRLKYSRQVSTLKKYFKDIKNGLINIPGKYLLQMLKIKLRKLFSISQMSIEAFTYRLAKNCQLSELQYLKEGIINYTK